MFSLSQKDTVEKSLRNQHFFNHKCRVFLLWSSLAYKAYSFSPRQLAIRAEYCICKWHAVSGYSSEYPTTLSTHPVINWCWRSTSPAGMVFCKCAQLNFQRCRLFYWMTVMYNNPIMESCGYFFMLNLYLQKFLAPILFRKYILSRICLFWMIIWCFPNCQAVRREKLLLCRQTFTVIPKYLYDHFCLQHI